MEYDFIGEIMLFAFNWIPVYTLPCDGRILPIQGNEMLYSVIGPVYGGDGRTTFALPDLGGAQPHPSMQYCIVTYGIYPTRS
ncbi:phage tail protein [Anaerotignum propionicum]|uniref:Phage Tail Collar Domain n=1 Tax=Anaerotignum propionicum DSM 1682 TaxID=991789 RepID=A0A0X1U8S8_ANAPI|nr:tail fiber protein [Anaerotignum propionicum]AMJ41353.1 phage tail collar domain protein [Anaerotignum propionicum DSM 1682]MEA5057704.1 tail fiber protein [Anaerotignum propionicum]SHE97667.1 Phage Tail Collar Domain [[Clostridium] propionicum DSM 1682] [Anaerotignum propionicum DSM 1682]